MYVVHGGDGAKGPAFTPSALRAASAAGCAWGTNPPDGAAPAAPKDRTILVVGLLAAAGAFVP
jgi:hypothetical protein